MPENGELSEEVLKFKSHLTADESRQERASHALPEAEANKAVTEKFGDGVSSGEFLGGSKHYPDGQGPEGGVVVTGGTDTAELLEKAYGLDTKKTSRQLASKTHSFSPNDSEFSNEDKKLNPLSELRNKPDRGLVLEVRRQDPNFKDSPAERFWIALISSVERVEGTNGGGASFVGELTKTAEKAKREGRSGDAAYVQGIIVSQMAELGARMSSDLKPIFGQESLEALSTGAPELATEFFGTKVGREKELLEVGEALGLLKDVVSGGERRAQAVRAIQERFQKYFNHDGFEDVWQDPEKKYLMPVEYDGEKGEFRANKTAVKAEDEKIAEVVRDLNGSLMIGQYLSKFEVNKGLTGEKGTPVFLPHWSWNDETVWQSEQAKLPPEDRGLPFRYTRVDGKFSAVADELIVKPEHPVIVDALSRLKETIPDLIFSRRVVDESELDKPSTLESIRFIQGGKTEVTAIGDVKMWTNEEIAEVVQKMRENPKSEQIGAEVDGKPLFLELDSMKKFVRSQLPEEDVAEDLKFVLVVPADADTLIWQEFAALAKEKGQEIVVFKGQVSRQTANEIANYVMARAGINQG